MTAEITEEVVPGVQHPDDVSDEAPYGYMTDPDTGARRPRKRPGRRSKTAKVPTGPAPDLETLQSLGSLPEASEDVAPGAPPKGKLKAASRPEVPNLRAGVMAKAINRQYRRAGRIVRMWDRDIGSAIIACTKPDPDAEDGDDTTVGEAWENLGRTNPKIRAFLMGFVRKGAIAQVFEVHLPIVLAVLLKDGIQRRLPMLRIAEALFEQDDEGQEEGGEPGFGQMMGGLGPEDMAQMMAMAQGMMGQMAANVPRPASSPRPPTPAPEDLFINGMEHPADQG